MSSTPPIDESAPPQPRPPEGSSSSGRPGWTVELPSGAEVYLLVVPADDESTSPGQPQPDQGAARAVPLTAPPGTRGIALVVPLPGTAAPASGHPGARIEPVSVQAAPAHAAPAQVVPTQVVPTQVVPTRTVLGQAALTSPAATSPAATVRAAVVPAAGATSVGAPTTESTVDEKPVASPAAPAGPPAFWPLPTYGPAGAPGPLPLPPPTFLPSRWPGPSPAAGRRVPAAVLAGALASAVFIPLNRSGIGWVLGGLGLVVAVAIALLRRPAGVPQTARWASAGWAAAAVALLAVPAVRNAWWLVTFCVLGGLGCAALAIVGGRSVRSILFSLVAAPFAGLRGLGWLARHIQGGRRAPVPNAPTRSGLRAFWVVVVTGLVVIVFGSLLASADAAFSQLLSDLVPTIDVPTVIAWSFLFVVGGLIATSAVYTLSAPPDLSGMESPARRRLSVVEVGLPLGALVLLFGGFVAVQVTVLFGGERHVLQTAGLSYAEYARSGFWQLSAVTILTLAVLGGAARWGRRDQPIERLTLRILLGLLCGLSVVIVASALDRLYTYQQVYSFTGERIFVMAFELLLGTVFLLILAAGIQWRGAWIPRTVIALGVVMLLALAVMNPEDYAARRNIERYQDTGKIDAWYLRALSVDATPALATLPDAVRRCTLSWIAVEVADPDPWYAWNLGRERARATLDQIGSQAVGGSADCRTADQFDLPKTR